jgi:hypothetical protein
MYKSIRNIGITSSIVRYYQTIGDFLACLYLNFLSLPYLFTPPLLDNIILLYQRNIKEISKKYQRNIKEISKKYQRNIKEISKKTIIYI